MSSNLQTEMYGDGDYYATSEAKPKIPRIEQGYYYFLDRHTDAKNKHDDTDLRNRYSYNFSLAMYDSKTDKLYYYELDT